jgi:hypothetical protein
MNQSTDDQEQCWECGAGGPGEYDTFTWEIPMPRDAKPVLVEKTLFHCAGCVGRAKEERASERELWIVEQTCRG